MHIAATVLLLVVQPGSISVDAIDEASILDSPPPAHEQVEEAAAPEVDADRVLSPEFLEKAVSKRAHEAVVTSAAITRHKPLERGTRLLGDHFHRAEALTNRRLERNRRFARSHER